ncbi:MAG: heme exporter protein D [Pseudoalteromonas tetraodonis]|jgi:heme exporter protein D
MSDFFAMGGYAAYVWPSYAVFALVIIFHIVVPRIAKRAVLKDVLIKKRRDQIKKQNMDLSE